MVMAHVGRGLSMPQLHLADEKIIIETDRGQGVVQFMDNTRCEHADRAQLLLLAE